MCILKELNQEDRKALHNLATPLMIINSKLQSALLEVSKNKSEIDLEKVQALLNKTNENLAKLISIYNEHKEQVGKRPDTCATSV